MNKFTERPPQLSEGRWRRVLVVGPLYKSWGNRSPW